MQSATWGVYQLLTLDDSLDSAVARFKQLCLNMCVVALMMMIIFFFIILVITWALLKKVFHLEKMETQQVTDCLVGPLTAFCFCFNLQQRAFNDGCRIMSWATLFSPVLSARLQTCWINWKKCRADHAQSVLLSDTRLAFVWMSENSSALHLDKWTTRKTRERERERSVAASSWSSSVARARQTIMIYGCAMSEQQTSSKVSD